MQTGRGGIDREETGVIFYIELVKHSARVTMELEANCETDARRKLEEAMLLYDVSPTQVIGIHAKNTVHHSPDAE